MMRRALVGPVRVPEEYTPRALAVWWEGIAEEYGRYPCIATLLALPADREAIRYATEFGDELDAISQEHCLVIALSKTGMRRSGFDRKLWTSAVSEHVYDGHSARLAGLFGVDFAEFPCLLVFRDIHSEEYRAVSLKGMTAEQIVDEMRSIFSVIRNAVREGGDPLSAVGAYGRRQAAREKGRALIGEVRRIAAGTLLAAIQAWLEAWAAAQIG
jgi:hypothetical protein